MALRNPGNLPQGNGAKSIRLQLTGLGDVAGRFRYWTSDHRPRRRNFRDMPPESLRCKECKTPYPLDARYVCEQCFGPLEVIYPPRADLDPAALRRRIQAGPHSIWRSAAFLPLAAPPRGTLPAGWTPLLRADRLAARLGLRNVWIKN